MRYGDCNWSSIFGREVFSPGVLLINIYPGVSDVMQAILLVKKTEHGKFSHTRGFINNIYPGVGKRHLHRRCNVRGMAPTTREQGVSLMKAPPDRWQPGRLGSANEMFLASRIVSVWRSGRCNGKPIAVQKHYSTSFPVSAVVANLANLSVLAHKCQHQSNNAISNRRRW